MGVLAGLIACMGLAPGAASAQEMTSVLTVQRIQMASDGVFYVVAPQRWGAPSCPSAEYVYVLPTVTSRKEMLALVLAAKATGATVQFRGTCQVAGGNYFVAEYLIVN